MHLLTSDQEVLANRIVKAPPQRVGIVTDVAKMSC